MIPQDEVPLRRLFRIVNGGTPTGEPQNWNGDVQWATPIDLGLANGSILRETQRTLTDDGLRSGSASVPSGSLIVSIRAPIGYVSQVGTETAFNQGCKGLVPKAELDLRFFRYVLISRKSAIASKGQGSTFVELSSAALADFRVPKPALVTQRAIADYLDTEAARIDALIGRKRSMIDLLQRRAAVQTETMIRELSSKFGDAPLKYVVDDIVVGIVVTPAAWYVLDESGVAALRGVNVGRGRLHLDDLVRISPEGHALHTKSVLRSGDIVVVRTGQAGSATVVPPDLDGANCIDLIVIRPGRQDPLFLEFALNSDWTQKHIERHSVGTIQSHFNVGAMKELRIPMAPLPVQTETAQRLRRVRTHTEELCGLLDRQVLSLRERRQGLITAAVTGELEIPRAT